MVGLGRGLWYLGVVVEVGGVCCVVLGGGCDYGWSGGMSVLL